MTGCERCGGKAHWWCWAEGYARHALCGSCLEPVAAKLGGTVLGKIRIEAIDPHSRRLGQFGFGALR